MKMSIRGEITTERYSPQYRPNSSLFAAEYSLRTLNREEGQFIMEYCFAAPLLSSAIEHDKIKAFEYNLEKHPRAITQLDFEKNSIFHFLTEKTGEEIIGIISEELAKNKRLKGLLNLPNIFGITPLLKSITKKNSKISEFLISVGAKHQLRDRTILKNLVEKFIEEEDLEGISLIEKTCFRDFEALEFVEGNNVCHLALFCTKKEIFEYFAILCPNLLKKANLSGKTPTDVIKKLELIEMSKIIDQL